MSQIATLQQLANDVRNKTIHLLESTADAEMLWAPSGTSNHILWHAGHALWLGDAMCLELILGRSMLPAAWPASFGAKCRPVPTTKTWPNKAQIVSSLRAQLRAILQELGKLHDDDLARKISTTSSTSLGSRILHGFHDEANHQGEMYLIQKMLRGRRSSSSKA